MSLEHMHPADRLVAVMDRIYQNGLTTTSGGNLSILDDNGDIWITPSGIDKGTLSRGDICRVKPDGSVEGSHKPSVELPFHASVYQRCPNLRAVLHAHPPSLVAFSLVRRLPDVNLAANIRRICGSVSMAAYAVPGSELLGRNIAAEFEKGYNAVVLENHGVCVGADTLSNAYMIFETLEACAALEINARKLGELKPLTEGEINIRDTCKHLDEFAPTTRTPVEQAIRHDIVAFIRRSCRQGLFSSAQGTISTRLPDGSFIITPRSIDRMLIDENDLILVRNGRREAGKHPPRSVMLHQEIYARHPAIDSVFGAAPPYSMAFAVTGSALDPRTIPEAYIQLRHIQRIPFSAPYLEPEQTADLFSEKTPVLICENNQILATGHSLLAAFDRLETAEATARSLLAARELGDLVRISDEEIREIETVFKLP